MSRLKATRREARRQRRLGGDGGKVKDMRRIFRGEGGGKWIQSERRERLAKKSGQGSRVAATNNLLFGGRTEKQWGEGVLVFRCSSEGGSYRGGRFSGDSQEPQEGSEATYRKGGDCFGFSGGIGVTLPVTVGSRLRFKGGRTRDFFRTKGEDGGKRRGVFSAGLGFRLQKKK